MKLSCQKSLCQQDNYLSQACTIVIKEKKMATSDLTYFFPMEDCTLSTGICECQKNGGLSFKLI